jgi:SAM-dependent methyltransferase
MHNDKKAAIDDRISAFYGATFDEDARLTTRSLAGQLEFRRTQEVLGSYLSEGRVLDVGGGTGRHSRALLQRGGFDIRLIDPVARHVNIAISAGIDATMGDARSLSFDNDSFDAALLLGPLYHLVSAEDRLTALREAARVTRSGGYVFVAALSRFVAFGAASLGAMPPSPYPTSWINLLEHGDAPDGLRFPAGHFHTAEELEQELDSAGLDVTEVIGIEGPAGLFLEQVSGTNDPLLEAALTIARATGSGPGIRDISSHLLAVATVPAA